MTLELTREGDVLLSAIIKRLDDEDVSEWLRQEKQILDLFGSTSCESYKAQIEIAYENLRKKIADASGFDNR
jgi:hypothetical protein